MTDFVERIQELREHTGLGLLDAKRLVVAGADLAKVKSLLQMASLEEKINYLLKVREHDLTQKIERIWPSRNITPDIFHILFVERTDDETS